MNTFSSISKSALVVTFLVGIANALFVPSTADAQVYTYAAPQINDLQNLLPKCTLGADPVLITDSPHRTTLRWTTQNAATVRITDVGDVAAVGEFVVTNVTTNRTFVLSATNAYGMRTCKVDVFGQSGYQSGYTTGTGGAYYTGTYHNAYNNNPIYNGVQPYGNYATTYQYSQPQYPQYSQQYNQYAYPNTYIGANPVTYGSYNDIGYRYGEQRVSAVRLSRVPYTGPIEDAVAGFFSLSVLVSSLYGIRRLIA